MIALTLGSVDSSDESAAHGELGQAFKQLYLELKLEIEQQAGRIEPAPTSATVANRSAALDFVREYVLTGVNIGAFAGAFALLKLFLERQPKIEATLTYPDGFVLRVSQITPKQAERLHRMHINANADQAGRTGPT
jgi:hypothetical protein